MAVRFTALIRIHSFPDDLDSCISSLGGMCDEIVLASALPGFHPDPEGRYCSNPLVISASESLDAFLTRAVQAASGEAIVMLFATDRLSGAPGAWQAALEGADALSVPVATLSNMPGPGSCSTDPENPENQGASWRETDLSVRVFRKTALAGFGPSRDRIRLRAGAKVRTFSEGPTVLAGHRLGDTADGTPASAYLQTARQVLLGDPNEPEALVLIKASAVGPPSYQAAERLAEIGKRTLLAPEVAGDVIATMLGAGKLDDARSVLIKKGTRLDAIAKAMCLASQAQYKAALAAQTIALDLSEAPIASDVVDAANYALLAGDDDRAQDLAEQVLAYAPEEPKARVARAMALMNRGLTFRAMRDLRIALDIEPWNRPAREYLAIACDRLGISPGTDAENGDMPPPETMFGPLGPTGVLSYIPHLAGGAGRVAVDLIRVLAPEYRQALVTIDDGENTGMGLRRELDQLGVPVVSVMEHSQLIQAQAIASAGLVLAHYWPNPLGPPVGRRGQRRIAISHGANRLPTEFEGYVCLTPSHAGQHRDLPKDMIHILPNGVDCALFSTAEPDATSWHPRAPKDGTIRIALLSRLTETKLYARLLHVLAPLAGYQVDVAIAGAGARRWRLEDSLKRTPINVDIRFVGPIPSRETPGFLAAADIGLHLTQSHRETLSITILEMMAAGLPIVAQPRGCLPELVEHGQSGFLFESEADLSDALCQLLKNPEMRARFGAAAQVRARAYDMPHFARRWRDFVADQLVQSAKPVTVASPLVVAEQSNMDWFAQATRRRGIGEPARTLFLAANPRSGGTMLSTMISATRRFGNMVEHLAKIVNDKTANVANPVSADTYIANVMATSASLSGRFGCRLSFGQFGTFCSETWMTPQLRDIVFRMTPLAWVRLIRRDRLGQAISFVKASQTGAWSDAGNEKVAAPKPYYDGQAIAIALKWIAGHEAGWDRFFADNGLTPLTLVYEDLAADTERGLRQVFDYLGEPLPTGQRFPPTIFRQADRVNEDWAVRYRVENGETEA